MTESVEQKANWAATLAARQVLAQAKNPKTTLGRMKPTVVAYHAAMAAIRAWCEVLEDHGRPNPMTETHIREHNGPCIYCMHGPYCLTCPPPPVIADDAPVCGRCREAITRSEIAADPYYSGGTVFGDGA